MIASCVFLFVTGVAAVILAPIHAQVVAADGSTYAFGPCRSGNEDGTGLAPENLNTAGDYSVLTPAALTLGDDCFIHGLVAGDPRPGPALFEFNAVYESAQGTAAPVINSFAGARSIGGVNGNPLVLEPGVYDFAAALNIIGPIEMYGDDTSTWLIKVNGALTVVADLDIELTGTARAENVVWQIEGALVVGARDNFVGTVLSSAAVTIGAGVEMEGRILAMGAVTVGASVRLVDPCWPDPVPMAISQRLRLR
jgi:hypothetical protein